MKISTELHYFENKVQIPEWVIELVRSVDERWHEAKYIPANATGNRLAEEVIFSIYLNNTSYFIYVTKTSEDCFALNFALGANLASRIVKADEVVSVINEATEYRNLYWSDSKLRSYLIAEYVNPEAVEMLRKKLTEIKNRFQDASDKDLDN